MRAALGRAALPDGLDGTSKRTAAVTDGLGTVERVDFAMVHVGTTMVSPYRTDSVGLTLPGVLVADDSQTPAKATPHGFAGWVNHMNMNMHTWQGSSSKDAPGHDGWGFQVPPRSRMTLAFG